MAPARKPQRTSNVSFSSDSRNQTPKAKPKGRAMITQRQKQALIDNLQLEITERARKLRAQYALQAQSLHTRIELRVNRIPTSLRNITMGELLDRHSRAASNETQKAAAASSLSASMLKTETKTLQSAAPPVSPVKPTSAAPAAAPRGIKRHSDLMEDDKENTAGPNQTVANPKKRSKPEPKGERRAPDPATVLSPKSSNARNMLPPPSPCRNQLGSIKGATSRPASPIKHASPTKPAAVYNAAEKPRAKSTATTASTRSRPATVAGTGGASVSVTNKSTASANDIKPYAARTKRGLAVASDRAVSSASSNTSGTSAGTTIVKKVGRALAAKTTASTAAKKTAGVVAANTGSVRSKTTAAAAAKGKAGTGMAVSGAAAAGTGTRRTLRKRT